MVNCLKRRVLQKRRTLLKVNDMSRLKNVGLKHVVITIQRQHLEEIKNQGFSSIDSYIEHLKAMIVYLQNQNKGV